MEKDLTLDKRIKQRFKGTHDSPCLSNCSHKQGDVVCNSCGMLREEKKGWKRRSEQEKSHIRLRAAARFSLLDIEADDNSVMLALPNAF